VAVSSYGEWGLIGNTVQYNVHSTNSAKNKKKDEQLPLVEGEKLKPLAQQLKAVELQRSPQLQVLQSLASANILLFQGQERI
jgi:hypothetical protein